MADAWPYGDVHVLEHLWRQVGLPGLIDELLDGRRISRRWPAGGRYIACVPVHQGGEVDKEVVSRRGRYVVCFNPREAERQRTHRAQMLSELAAELATEHTCSDGEHSKRVCELCASGRYGRYIRLTRTGRPMIDPGQGQGG